MHFDLLEPLLSAEDAMQADKHTIVSLGISGSELMERAGLAVAQKVESVFIDPQRRSGVPVFVICGPGNNGGDGWVAARRLWQNGVRTLVVSLAAQNTLKNEAQVASSQFMAASTNELWTLPNLDSCVQTVASANHFKLLLEQYRPNIVVDAIFGTGLKRPVEELTLEVIKHLNEFRLNQRPKVYVIAVDIPSGLPSDGQLWTSVHVVADSTIAIQYRKISHVSGAYLESCGEVTCVDVGIQLARPPLARVLLEKDQPALSLLRLPTRHSYKGQFGHVGVLFGSNGIQGASSLCAYSALRAGAGLVTLLIPTTSKIETLVIPEIMRHTLTSPLESEWLARLSSFVVGSGVNESRYEVANDILHFALEHLIPVVVDAGALPLLKTLPKGTSKTQVIATPHPGEAARLLSLSAHDIEKDRIKAALALLHSSQDTLSDITWILKGSSPIIAHASQGLIVCEGGVTTLAVGGSGDVLAGLCGALCGQTESSFDAALLGVSAHLAAGRRLAARRSRGYLAHEIADTLALVLFESQKHF